MLDWHTYAMVRRHPALCVVAAVYFVGLALLCLTPNSIVARGSVAARRLAPWASASAAEVVIGVVLFVPVGVLLVLIVGRRRWAFVLVTGVLAAFWLRLAEMVWMPRERIDAGSVAPHIAGTAVGVLLALVLLRARRRTPPRRAVVPTNTINQRP
jgi:hypothetical protein